MRFDGTCGDQELESALGAALAGRGQPAAALLVASVSWAIRGGGADDVTPGSRLAAFAELAPRAESLLTRAAE